MLWVAGTAPHLWKYIGEWKYPEAPLGLYVQDNSGSRARGLEIKNGQGRGTERRVSRNRLRLTA